MVAWPLASLRKPLGFFAPMGERTWLLVVLLVGLLVGTWLLQPRPTRPGEGLFPIVGRPAPAFSLTGVHGGFDTTRAQGQPMILAFWTTWCGACKHDLVLLEDFHRRWGDQVRVVGICPERLSEAPRIVAELGITFPVVWDPGAQVTRQYQLSESLRYPFTVFVQSNGIVGGVWGVRIEDLRHLLNLLTQSGIVVP